MGSLLALRTRLLAGLSLWPRFVPRLRISAGLLILRLPLLLELRLLTLLLELRLLPLLLELRLLVLLLELRLLPLLLELRLLVLLLELRPLLVVVGAAIVVEVVLGAFAALIAMEAHRTGRSHRLRMTTVVPGVEGAIGTRSLEMLLLNIRRSLMALVHRGPFKRGWIMADTTGAAVVRDVVIVNDRRVMDDGLVHIGIVDDRPIHIDDRGVIGKLAAVPLATHETDPHIPESVIHAAVKANVRPPVAGMKDVQAA